MNRKARNAGIAATLFLAACAHERSPVTGWDYNNPKFGGFQVVPYEEQETGPGLVFIEGGTFTMGRTEDDVMYDWNNMPRRVTVSSFYMDETEVTNTNYREYLYWLNSVFGPTDYHEILVKALPDTLCWRDPLAFNEPYVKYYLRHPAYADYPVVGVNWLQASDFCKWRTDRVNEFILLREGIIATLGFDEGDYFNTDAYLAGKFGGQINVPLHDMDPKGSGTRGVRMEDGIFLPDYRLPTEAEWEFAALGLVGNLRVEFGGVTVSQRRIYPWNGHATRNPEEKYLGEELADFKIGGGDNMGVAGNLNDAADITAPVYSFWPNDYGLYGMAGNVSEWVMDVYRPLTPEDESDFRSFRGNVFKTPVVQDGEIQTEDSIEYDSHVVKAQDGSIIDTLNDIVGVPGQVKYRPVTSKGNQQNVKTDNLIGQFARRNYNASTGHDADYRDYKDGDIVSSQYYHNMQQAGQMGNKVMYETGTSTLIGDDTHVYKGGSWKDRAFWMSPGTRRYLDEHQATDYIGFRCAMTRVGSPLGLGGKQAGGHD